MFNYILSDIYAYLFKQLNRRHHIVWKQKKNDIISNSISLGIYYV